MTVFNVDTAVRHLAFSYLRDARHLVSVLPDDDLSDAEVDIEGELGTGGRDTDTI